MVKNTRLAIGTLLSPLGILSILNLTLAKKYTILIYYIDRSLASRYHMFHLFATETE